MLWLHLFKGNCLYGDDFVSVNDIGFVFTLPAPLMACGDVIKLILSNGLDPVWLVFY